MNTNSVVSIINAVVTCAGVIIDVVSKSVKSSK